MSLFKTTVLYVFTTVFCLLNITALHAQITAEIKLTTAGKPDLTGIWAGPGFAHTGGELDNPSASPYTTDNMAPFQIGGEALLTRPQTGNLRIDDPTAICLPNGLTRQIPSP